MRVYRTSGKGSNAFMVLEVDNIVPKNLIKCINEIPHIKDAIAINPVKEEE